MRYVWSALGVLISAAALYYFWQFMPENLLREIAAHGPAFLAGAAVLAPAYVLRAAKTWILLNEPAKSKRQIAGSLYASIALNNVLPFRLGDVLRLFYLRSILSISLAKTTSALLFERLVDLALILLLFAATAGVLLGERGMPFLMTIAAGVPTALIWLAIAGAIAGLIGAVVFRTLALKFLAATIGTLGLTTRRLALFLACALGQWVLEILVLGYVLSRLVPNVPGAEGILSSFMCNLSTLVPSAPGYVGTFEVAGILPFKLLLGAVAPEHALFVVLYHLVIWTFSTGLGLIAGILLALFDGAAIRAARLTRAGA